ncbi:MAG: hypothetical protein ACKV22_22965 [Bryobacteraceae bacterium]
MPTASVTEVTLWTPKHALKEAPIGPQNIQVDFTVTTSHDGCFAIAVEVLDHDELSGNDILASNLTVIRLRCYCFKAGQPRQFSINGGAGQPQPAPGPGVAQMEPLEGKWPENDGVFDDDLEPFANIQVYDCKKPCTAEADCGFIPTGGLDDETSVGGITTKPAGDIDIIDGTGWKEGMGLLEKVAGVGAGAIPKISRLDKTSDPYVALVVRHSNKLEKRIRSLERRLQAAALTNTPATPHH